MARSIPTINTNRVTLRAMRPQDFEDFAALWREEAVYRTFRSEPLSRTESWRQFLLIAGHWQIAGFGLWGIEPHGTRRIMGQVGFWFAGRELGEDYDANPEASLVLHPEYQGTSLGKDAAQGAHDWFDRVVTGPVVCEYASGNASAEHLAVQLGYTELREAKLDGSTRKLMLRKSPPGSRG